MKKEIVVGAIAATSVFVLTNIGEKILESTVEPFFEKPEFSIQTNICRGGESTAVAINDQGKEMIITDISAQLPITHIFTLENNGTQVINDYDFDLSLFPESLSNDIYNFFQLTEQDISKSLEENKILDFIVFYESSKSTHRLSTTMGHAISRIKLENFNPGDQISVLFESRTPWTATASMKGNNITYRESHEGNCLSMREYGGVVTYRWTDPECKTKKYPDLSFSCKWNAKIPNDFINGGEILIEHR